jgi:hypothetical protein
MDTDAIDNEIQKLKRDRDRLQIKVDRVRQDFDLFQGRLRYPGTQFLIDLEYLLVLDVTLSCNGPALTIGNVFETLPGALHAVYTLSAYATDSDVPVIMTDGSVLVAPADSVTVAIQRRRQSTPVRTEARIVIYNNTAAAKNIAVRVWRRLGMGS